MDLIFLPEAEDDIDRLFEFLQKENVNAAARAMLLIDDGARRLEDFPEIGMLMDDASGRREFLSPLVKAYMFYDTAYLRREIRLSS